MSETHTHENYARGTGSGPYDVGGSGSEGRSGAGLLAATECNILAHGSNTTGRGSEGGNSRGRSRGGAQVPGGRGAGREAGKGGNARGWVSRGSPRHQNRQHQNHQQHQEQQRFHTPSVDPSRVVKRPLRNTRQFQVAQLQRRFQFKGDDGTHTATEFTINLKPSDPEFPYDVDSLNFVLKVPLEYGTLVSDGKADEITGTTVASDEDHCPTIHVLNEDIPIGFRINIENGFKDVVRNALNATTLLDMINTLDKRLESFLAAEKASTIKIIPNAPRKLAVSNAGVGSSTSLGLTKPDDIVGTAYVESPTTRSESKAPPSLPDYPPEVLSAASAKREQDVRQLEARLGRSGVFSKTEAPDGGLVYTVPLEARRRDMLPVPLLNLQSIILRVPKLFNLEPCAITISGVTKDVSDPLEKKFTNQVKANPQWSLMAHLNALAANLHTMATKVMEEEAEAKQEQEREEQEKLLVKDLENKAIIDETDTSLLTTGKGNMHLIHDNDKEHIVVIPRPPEWSYESDGEGGQSDTDDDSDYEDSSEDGEKKDQGIPSQAGERGTSLSFPGIQMPGIQLLEVLVLNVTIRCTKCKTTVDVMQVRPGGKPRFDRCGKCSSIYGIGKIRVGYMRNVDMRNGDCEANNGTSLYLKRIPNGACSPIF